MNAPASIIAAVTAALTINMPALAKGELLAGILFGKNDEPDQLIIKLPGEGKNLPWAKAMEKAKALGGEAPTLRELALLRANLREEFADDWYWSSEQHADAPACAWSQDFSSGNQTWGRKGSKLRVVAVRRVPIQQLTIGVSA